MLTVVKKTLVSMIVTFLAFWPLGLVLSIFAGRCLNNDIDIA